MAGERAFIIAGGVGSRIRPHLREAGFPDVPKHLLPIGENDPTTLVRRATLGAVATGREVQVISNPINHDLIDADLGDLSGITIDETHANSCLGPFCFCTLTEQGSTAVGISGDVFVDHFDLDAFMDQHEASGATATFLVGKTATGSGAAIFELDESGLITKVERTTKPETMVVRNIGIYAVSRTPELELVINRYADSKTEVTDDFAQAIIDLGVVRASMHHGPFVNVNTVADYRELLDYTASRPVDS